MPFKIETFGLCHQVTAIYLYNFTNVKNGVYRKKWGIPRTEDHREEPKEDHITGDPDEDPREGSDGWPKDTKEDPITEKPQENFITEDPALYKFRNSRREVLCKKGDL